MDLGKLLRDAKRRGRMNINVAHKTNIKVARNVAKGDGSAVASARQDVVINQRHDDKPSDGHQND